MKTNRFFSVLVSVYLCCALFASNAWGDTIAYVSWCRESQPDHCSKIWKINLDTGTITTLGTYSQLYMDVDISPLDNNLYGFSTLGTNPGTWEINQTTGLISSVWGPANCGATAFSPDGTLYTHKGARQKLTSYDLVNQTGEAFGNALPQIFPIVAGLAINSQGEAIAGDNQKKIYSVDLSNGDFTALGVPTGMPFSLRGFDYDSSDRLIAFFDTGLYSINVGNMSATQLMSLTPPATGFQGQGIAIVNVPEPTTLVLLLAGLATGSLTRFRRKK